jgi:hypothetical protein
VAGLAFVLVQTMPRDGEVEPPIAVEMSRQPAPAEAPSVAPSAPATEGAIRAEAVESSEMQRAPVAPPDAQSNEAMAPPAAASSGAVEGGVVAEPGDAAKAEAPSEADTAAGTRYRAAPPTPSTAALPAPPPAPGDWAARIESLYDAGDVASAATELRAFRAEYEDADRHLPGTLREWAASVK